MNDEELMAVIGVPEHVKWAFVKDEVYETFLVAGDL